ncbi:unnamed protein product, partial [Ostreobium quekettii]
VSRGLLPDTGSDYEGTGGNIHDAMDFLLSNFIEMNKLWVRMQHQGSKLDQDKREMDRKMLQDLVGKNLTYLSQLDGLDFHLYSGVVLSRVLDQIICCEDVIAQQYLMQCVIHCFPDEFHLGTLDDLLGTLPRLKEGVKVHLIMAGLMDRLAQYAEKYPTSVRQVDAFARFETTCCDVTAQHPEMHAGEVIEMYVALLAFTGSVHPDRLDYVNGLLEACHKALRDRGTVSDPKGEKTLVDLLSAPLTRYDVVRVLGLDSYPRLMDLLRMRKRKDMAVKIVQAITEGGLIVDSFENVRRLFTFIAPLIKDAEGFDEEIDDEDLEDEQTLIARLVHSLWSPIPAEQMKILEEVGKQFEDGGFRRMKFNLPPLVFAGLKLIKHMSMLQAKGQALAGGVTFEGVLDWLLARCHLIVEVPRPMMALRCLLHCGHAASEEARLEDTAYDCFEQACTLFEESISSSSEKETALQAIIGTLHRCHVFPAESRAALAQTVSGYCANLLKKEEQCRAVCLYSHVFWQQEVAADAPARAGTAGEAPVRDPVGVMRSLKRCIKLANAAQRRSGITARSLRPSVEPVSLYVELLNQYLFYFEAGNSQITLSVLQQLIDLVANEMADKQAGDGLKQFYKNTLEHVNWRQGTDEKYKGLQVPALPAA